MAQDAVHKGSSSARVSSKSKQILRRVLQAHRVSLNSAKHIRYLQKDLPVIVPNRRHVFARVEACASGEEMNRQSLHAS
jgi:hypothetical protein